ncbi:uncharacterized protein L201_004284 [Kwoniella dendrophila CBS 6074]|uniref:ubiquitinyl hydrolase 1 n=1 Tax=Kwoniella dendrophila CBS 6074 TaxID=1295534 RepID=A0AAX4JVG5_9TREE
MRKRKVKTNNKNQVQKDISKTISSSSTSSSLSEAIPINTIHNSLTPNSHQPNVYDEQSESTTETPDTPSYSNPNSIPESESDIELSLNPSYSPPSDISESPSEEDLIPSFQSSSSNWSRTEASILGILINSSPWPLDELLRSLLSIFHQIYIEILKMVLGLGLLNWWSGSTTATGSSSKIDNIHMDNTKKVKRRRRKVESPQQNGHVYQESTNHFPGMVNLSGTLCYMNSVLQAFASITSLVNHLERIVELAVESDTPTPVTDALLEVIQDLNTPHSRSPPALRPHNLLYALEPLPQIRRLLSTREQQDAHELFIVLAEAISDESLNVVKDISKLRGLSEILSLQKFINFSNNYQSLISGKSKADLVGIEKRKKIKGLAQPWEGLMARRRTCQKCNHSTEIRMDLVGGMELPIPLHGEVTLDACIAEYLSPEYLSDVTCELCSLRTTLAYYQSEVQRLSSASNASIPTPAKSTHQSNSTSSGSFSALEGLTTIGSTSSSSSKDDKMTNSRKKRARDARRVENKLQEMVDSGVISNFNEPFLQPSSFTSSSSKSTDESNAPLPTAPTPIKWQISKTNSIRQSILTRSPKSLRLLFIRSEFTPYGSILKKTAKINFPIIIDLTRFISNDIWEEDKTQQLSKIKLNGFANGNHVENSTMLKQQITRKKVLYRLESVILHYGYTHSSGHYICLRRKPSPPNSPTPPTSKLYYRPKGINKSCPDECQCENCLYFGKVRQEDTSNIGPGKGWLRISDADVEEVGEEAFYESRASVFMLFYEKIGEYQEENKSQSQINQNVKDSKDDLNNASQVI